MLALIILQTGAAASEWTPLAQYGPTIILLALFLGFIVRIAPMWKEVRLKEIDMRGEENIVKREMAGAFGRLGESLGRMGDVLKDVAVEQRRATEETAILQRANNDTNDRLAHNVQTLNERLEKIERKRAEDEKLSTQDLVSRLETLENNVGSERATARA